MRFAKSENLPKSSSYFCYSTRKIHIILRRKKIIIVLLSAFLVIMICGKWLEENAGKLPDKSSASAVLPRKKLKLHLINGATGGAAKILFLSISIGKLERKKHQFLLP